MNKRPLSRQFTNKRGCPLPAFAEGTEGLETQAPEIFRAFGGAFAGQLVRGFLTRPPLRPGPTTRPKQPNSVRDIAEWRSEQIPRLILRYKVFHHKIRDSNATRCRTSSS